MIKATASAGAALTLLASAVATALAAPIASAEESSAYEVITAPAVMAKEAQRAVLSDIAEAGEADIAVGDYGIILRRTEQQWQQMPVPTSVFLSSVSFADAQHGWAVGHHGVIVGSSDGGQTWQRQLDGFAFIQLQQDYFATRIAQLTDEIAAAEAKGADELIGDLEFALETAEFNLENAQFAEEEGPTKPFLDVLALTPEVVLVAGAYGSLLRSTDAGRSWQVLDGALENPDGYHLNSLTADSDYTYLAGESGLLFRSADQGSTWETLDSPYYGSFFGLHVDAEQRLWAFGLRGNIFVSEDQGESFSQISLQDPVNINAAIDAPDGGVYLVGNAGVIAWANAAGEVLESTHSSGAALTDVVLNDDGTLTMVGQRGLLTQPALRN